MNDDTDKTRPVPAAHPAPGHGDQRTYSPGHAEGDGTFVGHGGGYGPPTADATSAADAAPGGEGTYGYPHGPGVGDTGGRHPDDEARERAVPADPEAVPGKGDRFGAGRQTQWQGRQDPGGLDAELEKFRKADPDLSEKGAA